MSCPKGIGPPIHSYTFRMGLEPENSWKIGRVVWFLGFQTTQQVKFQGLFWIFTPKPEDEATNYKIQVDGWALR